MYVPIPYHSIPYPHTSQLPLPVDVSIPSHTPTPDSTTRLLTRRALLHHDARDAPGALLARAAHDEVEVAHAAAADEGLCWNGGAGGLDFEKEGVMGVLEWGVGVGGVSKAGRR